jgi:predicted  nucleic acid-binding Zn-ribbon protein
MLPDTCPRCGHALHDHQLGAARGCLYCACEGGAERQGAPAPDTAQLMRLARCIAGKRT